MPCSHTAMRCIPLVLLVTVTGALASGCAARTEDAEASDAAFTGTEPSDSDGDGVPSTFHKDRLLEDSFYAAKDWATADEVQHFLENTVWNRASWLATE